MGLEGSFQQTSCFKKRGPFSRLQGAAGGKHLVLKLEKDNTVQRYWFSSNMASLMLAFPQTLGGWGGGVARVLCVPLREASMGAV